MAEKDVPRPQLCLTCRSPVVVLDRLAPTINQGSGWTISHMRMLVECPCCKTLRVYAEHRTRVDEGDHIKRSLR